LEYTLYNLPKWKGREGLVEIFMRCVVHYRDILDRYGIQVDMYLLRYLTKYMSDTNDINLDYLSQRIKRTKS